MSIRLGKIFRHSPDTTFNPNDHVGDFDKDAFKKSFKRITKITIRQGYDGSDFAINMMSTVFTANVVRIPRFLNPIRGCRHGKNKVL